MNNEIKDPQYELYQGDCREILPSLPEHSIDAIITSPPYWGLRSYKASPLFWDNHNDCEHEWENTERWLHRGRTKSKVQFIGSVTQCNAWRGQLGSEPDPDLFIKHLCDIFDLTKRVLKKTGSLWVNLDDSMSGSNNGSNDYRTQGTSISVNSSKYEGQKPAKTNIPAKSLCAIPERFILEMLKRGWIYRQCIIWQKPSCMPESVKDRFTRDYEYLYHFTQQGKYFFERQFEPQQQSSLERLTRGWKGDGQRDFPAGPQNHFQNYFNKSSEEITHIASLGRNKRSVWQINPEPQRPVKKGAVAHYAAFPTALCTIPILATVPEQICTKCGKPRVKVYEEKPMIINRSNYAEGAGIRIMSSGTMVAPNEVKEIGLSDCGCGAFFKCGVVLDLFGGTGTVAVEARKLGRKAILIEVSEQYSEIIKKRLERIPVPMMLEG